MRILILVFLLPLFLLAQKNEFKKFDKAVELYKTGEINKAKDILTKLIKKNPKWEQPNVLMSSILLSEGHVKKSVDFLLNIYNENHPDNILGLQRVANLYYENGFYNEAKKFYLLIWNMDSLICNKKTPLFIKNCNFAINAIKNPVNFNPTNLGESINSPFAEYLPVLSFDDQILYITKRVEKNGYIDNEDIFYSIRSSENEWDLIKSISTPINSVWEDGAMCISPNGKILVFTRCHAPDSYGGCDLYVSYLKRDNKWSVPQNIGDKINTKYKDTQPSFSADSKYLFFVSNRLGGIGGLDIWKSKISHDTNGFLIFNYPENLGDIINTTYNEMSPFLHADNLTLYFASDGHVGMGNYDIFISRRFNANSSWNNPQNIGFPINTFNVENSFLVSSDGSTAYFASDESGFGKEDIFSFVLPKNIKPDYLDDFEIEIIKSDRNEEIILKNVLFANNSYKLDSLSKLELNKLVKYLLKNPSISISIEGHTDNIGSFTDNLLLSTNRAKSVFDYLNSKLRTKQIISYTGFGDKKPINDNKSENARALNRRTSFKIMD